MSALSLASGKHRFFSHSVATAEVIFQGSKVTITRGNKKVTVRLSGEPVGLPRLHLDTMQTQAGVLSLHLLACLASLDRKVISGRDLLTFVVQIQIEICNYARL
jgi:hypothetical protein